MLDHSKLPIQETGRECIQVSEDGIHKAAERIKLPTKIAPFRLPFFLQATPAREYLCPQSFPLDVSSQGEIGSNCPIITVRLGHQQQRDFPAGCAFT